jgi:hypothetical protein
MKTQTDPDERLKKFKSDLRQLKENYNKAKGALDYQFAQIKKEYGVSTVTELEKEINKWKREREILAKKLSKGITDLEREYKWN